MSNQNCIFCELCNTWVHPTGIKSSNSELSQSNLPYYCSLCYLSIFPFQKLNDNQFAKFVAMHSDHKNQFH